jgi:hypothetical protein
VADSTPFSYDESNLPTSLYGGGGGGGGCVVADSKLNFTFLFF